MLYDIMLSLRLHIQENLPELTAVKLIYDGVSLPEEKPFVTIESLSVPTSRLSAGRISYQETYTLQVGVFANNIGHLYKLQESVKTLLLNSVPMHNSDKTFVCDVSDFTRIRNDDIANETDNHRGYFDVTVTILRDVGSKDFTQ
jgi:hypothetical protein